MQGTSLAHWVMESTQGSLLYSDFLGSKKSHLLYACRLWIPSAQLAHEMTCSLNWQNKFHQICLEILTYRYIVDTEDNGIMKLIKQHIKNNTGRWQCTRAVWKCFTPLLNFNKTTHFKLFSENVSATSENKMKKIHFLHSVLYEKPTVTDNVLIWPLLTVCCFITWQRCQFACVAWIRLYNIKSC